MSEGPQLWIVGSGPAGLGLAEACCRRGIRVGLLAPEPEAPWPANYGMWLDDAEALGVAGWLSQRWCDTRVDLSSGPLRLGRGYGLLDDRRLQTDWLESCRRRGARIHVGTLERLEHHDEGVRLYCRDGTVLEGALVVDAGGHGSTFVAREAGPEPGYQVAWGELWACEADLPEPGSETMSFMDWRDPHDDAGDRAGDELPPTFLYAMRLANDRVFLEETVLVTKLKAEGRPQDLFVPLRRRLHRRLEAQGLRARLLGADALEVERCVIPMGGPLPRGDQRTLAFGGAAAMVHPASGYMLTVALQRREAVAEAIARELEAWVGPGAPSRRIWTAIWPDERVRAWRLYTFGMQVIAGLDRAGIETFFSEFFALPPERWRGFLSASAPTPELMATMSRYFARAPWAIKRDLAAALLGPEGLHMGRGFVGLSR
ncbi:MAG: lycopene cyclase family protein [Myxococcales bacterium]|nr:lycopene cyclase family protein [Myxococcales bacterium]